MEQIGYEILVLGGMQKPTGHGPQQTAPADPDLSRELDLQMSLLISILFSLLLHHPSWGLYCLPGVPANSQVFSSPSQPQLPLSTAPVYSVIQHCSHKEMHDRASSPSNTKADHKVVSSFNVYFNRIMEEGVYKQEIYR